MLFPTERRAEVAIAARWASDVAVEWGRGGDADVSAWRLLAAVLQGLRDCLPLETAVALGNQLPEPIRGAYYGQWRIPGQPVSGRRERFLASVAARLTGFRLLSLGEVERAVACVGNVLDRHLTAQMADQVRRDLPDALRSLWPPRDARGTARGISGPKEPMPATPRNRLGTDAVPLQASSARHARREE